MLQSQFYITTIKNYNENEKSLQKHHETTERKC